MRTCWWSAAGGREWPPRRGRRSWARTSCSRTRAPSRADACWSGARRSGARELAAGAREAGVELISPGTAIGLFDGLAAIWERDTLHQVRAARHVIATGTIEQPLVFPGNDLPGVMLSRGARRLLAMYALAPGRQAVVATTSEEGLEAAHALSEAGVEIAAIADLRQGTTVVQAGGRRQVRAAVLASVDDEGNPVEGTARTVGCDLLVVSGGAAPAGSLLLQAGGRTAYDSASAAFAVVDVPDGLHAAGEVAGLRADDAIELSGALAGADAAHAAGFGDARSRERAEEQRRELDQLAAAPVPTAEPPPVAGTGRGKCFACLCEDVTAKDVHTSIEEGYDSIELSKRYLTVTMGPCQGRMCQLPAARLIARETGQDLESVGTTTARPPWSSVPLGALAGRPIEPAKRSVLHAHHRELGGNVMWAGDWRRAYDYGDPDAEVRAVQEAAGLIDVSTLGKLIVSGPDAGEFLDRLYPNRHGNLKPGRIRYGVLVSDAGRIIDDGTICRARRGLLLRHHDVDRRRGDRGVVRVVARRLVGPAGHAHGRHPGPVRGQPRRAAGAGDHGAPHHARLLERGLHLSGWETGARRWRALSVAPDRLRRRAGLRDPLPGRPRPARLGHDHGGRRASTASGRSGSSHSACCGCTRCTSSSARTRTPSRTRWRARCRGSSSSTRSRTSSAVGRSRSSPSTTPRCAWWDSSSRTAPCHTRGPPCWRAATARWDA